VLDRLAIGSVCTIYRCGFANNGREVEGVCKIARDARANSLVANEAHILGRLFRGDPGAEFTPFLPAVQDTFAVGDDTPNLSRQGNVLRLHEAIGSPDELYTLFEVRSHYRAGLDPRDVAWIWRRLLSVLGYIHSQAVVHGAVLPMHVLIEPRGHKLVLVDWCCASYGMAVDKSPVKIIAGGFKGWYKREAGSTAPPIPALDIAMGTRCMIDLLGGDPVRGEFPPALDPALKRHFRRCLEGGAGARSDAWRLLGDFDALIEALWGPRAFRPLPMPAKGEV
jgi:serine/threonine protein kinase